MAQKLLFDDVCDFNLGGIKTLFLSVYTDREVPYYPLNYNVSGYTITTILDGMTFQKIGIEENAVVEQERQNNEQGKWYDKTLRFTVAKIGLNNSRFINSFLFKRNVVNNLGQRRDVNIDGYNTTAIFEDMNGNWWIAGYDIPFKVTQFELETGEQGGGNSYQVTLRSRSYDRIRKIEGDFDCDVINYSNATTTTTIAPPPNCDFNGGDAIYYLPSCDYNGGSAQVI
jgi:hypothetical protein